MLEISGADLCDGTPIFDIKPYLPHIESKPSARGGFAKEAADYQLSVEVPEKIEKRLPFDSLEIIKKFFPRTRDRPISQIRRGCTVCPTENGKYSLRWKKVFLRLLTFAKSWVRINKR